MTDQGIFSYPGNDTFLVGAVPGVMKKYDELKKNQVLPFYIVSAISWLTEKERGPNDPAMDATKYPMVSFSFKGEVITYI